MSAASSCRDGTRTTASSLRSTYGVVNVSNLDTQPGNALHRTLRTSVNFMWNPVPFVDIVVEFLAGTRVNKDGERGSASQIQGGWTLKF